MGHKPKVRFYAIIDGRDVQLFSVRNRGSAGLVVTSTSSQYTEIELGKQLTVIEQHYSVHPSNKGKDTTITQKTQLENGDIHAQMSKIRDTAEYLLWPVFARRIPLYRADQRAVRARNNDTTVCIGEYNTQHSMLLYSVWVSLANFNPSDLMIDGSNIFTVKYGRYNISAITTYLWAPSLVEGDITGLATSSAVTNNTLTDSHISWITDVILPIHLKFFHYHLMEHLKVRFLERVDNLFDGSDVSLIEKLHDYVSRFYKMPYKKRE